MDNPFLARRPGYLAREAFLLRSTRMRDPCEHADDEHETAMICEVQIHYPSEDYPCVCEGLVTEGLSDTCVQCGHRAEKHLVTRRCRSCNCRTSSTQRP